MNWKDYEKEIFSHFESEFQNAEIIYDNKIVGQYSKVKRQIDILIEDYVAGNKIRIVVDCKYFNKKINVKDVESFIGMLKDVNAHKGLLITNKGYSNAAIKRAYYDTYDLELDILNFADLKKYQSFVAIPYAGDYGFIVPAPFGWIIDAHTTRLTLGWIYQRGLTLKEAQNNNEWMYISFWNKLKDPLDLDKLIKLQEDNTLASNPKAKFIYKSTIKRKDANTRIREIIIAKYPALEITGFVEFKEVIFFCVLFTPDELKNKNIRKLEYILSKVEPINIRIDNSILIKKEIKLLHLSNNAVNKAEIANKISHLYFEMKDFKNALKYCRMGVKFDSKHYSCLKDLLSLEFFLKDLTSAKKTSTKFFELDPKNPTVYLDLMNIYSKYNLERRLICFFNQKKIEFKTDYKVLGNINYHLGLFYQYLSKDSEAIYFINEAKTSFEKVFKLNHYVFKNISKIKKAIQNKK